ncbi:MAG: replication restart helicase PriA, partial [Candidatus Omnitrophota bacterium]
RMGRPANLFATTSSVRPREKLSGCLIHYQDEPRYWEALCRRIEDKLSLRQQILYLVPQKQYLHYRLGQLRQRFSSSIAVWDASSTAKQQFKVWEMIKNGEAQMVIGVRSAVFAPLPNPGLLIVEEEDNSLYKQEQGPFYHAREVALMRSKIQGCELMLTSRTPSLEAVALSKTQKFSLEFIPTQRSLPKTQVINPAEYRRRYHRLLLSAPLQEIISRWLIQNKRVILFINRKGFSTAARCPSCGFSQRCPRCDINLTFHYDKHKLVCRYCSFSAEPVELCPQCKRDYLRYSGAGAEKLESEAHRLFPQARIIRWESGKAAPAEDFNILITTQVILSRPAPPTGDCVVVLQVDSLLNRLDFRAAEKTFALLTRLMALTKEQIILQSHNEEHYTLKLALKNDFAKFYKQEMKLRRALGFPPFKHFLAVQIRGKSEARVRESGEDLFKELLDRCPKSVEVFPPQPDMPAKLRGNFRSLILLKGKDVKKINGIIRKSLHAKGKKSGIIIGIDVDV